MKNGFFQQASIGKYFSTLYRFSFFLIFPAVVVNYYFGKHTIHIFMVLSLFIAVSHYRGYSLLHSNEKMLVQLTLLIFLYTAIAGFLLQSPGADSRYWPSLESQLNWLLPLLVLMPLYLGWIKIKLRDFKLIIAFSAIIAGVAMLYNMAMGFNRGQLFHGHAIDYGNLSMLFGLFSFVFFIEEKNRRTKLLFLVAFILGLGASLHSGTRGGWIGLPMVLWLFWRWRLLSHRHWMAIVFSVVSLALLIGITDNPIKDRLSIITHNIQLWQDGNSSNSVGQRFEMWKIAFRGFTEHPVFGVGLGEFFSYKSNIIAAGDAPEHILRYKSPHSEFLNIIFSFGIIGALAYTAFFVWLWRFFSQALRSGITDEQSAGRIGQLLLVAFADFSLTETMLSIQLGGAIFFSICALAFYFLNQTRSDLKAGQ